MKPKKNIAFVVYSLNSGGAERVVTTLANYFALQYNVTIITIVNTTPFYTINKEITLKSCVDKINNSKNLVSALKNNTKLIKTIKKHLKSENINLVLSFMTTSNVLSLIASKSLKIPCIISERSNPYIYTNNSFWDKLVRYTYPKANFLVVQSNLIKNYYQTFVKSNRVIILPNPISETLSSQKNISKKRTPTIINVGRLDSNKAQDVLLKAFASINKKDWKLVLIGDGELRKDYEKLTKKLHIANNVIFTGNINDVQNYYNTASIFAFTSKSEGFPNALIEAMYFEMACISTDCPTGPSDIIENTKNGFLIEVNNQSQLESRLIELIDNNTLRDSLGKEAFKTAKAYEVTQVAEKWNELIIKLI